MPYGQPNTPPNGVPGPANQPQPGQPGPQGYQPPQPGQFFAAPQPGQPTSPFPQAQIPGQPQQYEPAHGALPAFQPAVPAYQPPKGYAAKPAEKPLPPAPPSAPTTPYDFFMKPQQRKQPLVPKAPLINNLPESFSLPALPAKGSKGRTKMVTRIAIVAGGAIILIFLVFIVQAMLPKDTNGPQIFAIAQTQTEVTRIADMGTKSKDRSIRGFAITTSLTTTTDQTAVLNYMKKNKYPVETKLLTATKNAKTDASLTAATASSDYNDTFKLVLIGQLNDYKRKVAGRLAVTQGDNERELLNNISTHIDLLIEQADLKDN